MLRTVRTIATIQYDSQNSLSSWAFFSSFDISSSLLESQGNPRIAIMSTVAASTRRMIKVATRKTYRAENDPVLEVDAQHPTRATAMMAIPLRISASDVSAHPPAEAF